MRKINMKSVVGNWAEWRSGASDLNDMADLELLEPRLLLNGVVDGNLVLDWSTYLGGKQDDRGYSIAVDSQDNILVTGVTNSNDFPGEGKEQNKDAFVVKFDSEGNYLWGTLLGGKGKEYSYGIAVDGDDNVVITGVTDSKDWVSGGYDESYNGKQDAFVVKLDSDGQELWSTYVGGSKEEYGFAIAVDGLGDIVITGYTKSKDLAKDGMDTEYDKDKEAFVAKLSSDGEHIWSTYLGGKKKEIGYGVATDSWNNVIVTGYTDSDDWTSIDFNNDYFNHKDAFVVKLDADGQGLWASHVGGDKEDYGYGVAVDSMDYIVITGYTKSKDLAYMGADSSYNDGKDAFVAKLNATGEQVWASYVGGSEEDIGKGIAVNSNDQIVITGFTKSYDFPTDNHAYYLSNSQNDVGSQNDYWTYDEHDDGDRDIFVAILNADSTFVWSDFLDGKNEDQGNQVAVNSEGEILAIGYTQSQYLAMGGYDASFNGDKDAIIAKWGIREPEPEIDVELPGQSDDVKEYDFGSVLTGQTAQVIFTVRNEGDAVLVVSEVDSISSPFEVSPVNGPDAADDWQIDPGLTMDFMVTFSPVAEGDYKATLMLASNDADEASYEIDLQGYGEQPQLMPAEIEVKQQGVMIVDDSPGPVNFGSIMKGKGAVDLVFTISNLGQEDLTLDNVSLIDSVGFEIMQQPNSVVVGGGMTELVIRMKDDTPGAQHAAVSFTNNDSDENPFDFKVSGNVEEQPLAPAEIEVTQQSVLIVDDSPGSFDFGSIMLGAGAADVTFTISNLGQEDLSLGSVSLSDPVNFEIIQQPDAVVAGGGMTQLVIRMNDDTPGEQSAAVSFTNNDSDENPFNFNVSGMVNEIVVEDGVVSDEFNDGSLNETLWQVVDFNGQSNVSVNGSQLEITIPAGVNHDIWAAGNHATRIVQAVENEDFQIEVKFDSMLSGQYAMQGILIEQDTGNFLRLEFFSDNSGVKVFAASFVGGSPKVEYGPTAVASDLPMLMRITRAGDLFTQEVKLGAGAWMTAASFTHPMTVTGLGVYAGNADNLPGHTVTVDYFRNIASAVTVSEQPLGTSSAIVHAGNNSADFNSDGQINLLDLAILGDHYGLQSGATKLQGDANGDGAVGLIDLAFLGDQYGATVVPSIWWANDSQEDEQDSYLFGYVSIL